MPALTWPHHLLRARSELWSPAASSFHGGRPFSGAAPQAVGFTGGGLWKARLNDVVLRTREQINAWHGLEGVLAGGVATIIVPRCDRRHGPRPAFGGLPEPFAGGSLFADGTGFASEAFSHTMAADAALRATSIAVAREGSAPLAAGMHFSIDHGGEVSWRLYRIVSVAGGGSTQVIGVRPPLRQAVPAGAALDFTLPRCLMRLKNPDGMELTVDMLRRAQPSVEFEESRF